MLVMTRHAGEVIQIGEDIEIVITHIGRSRVKVGIQAPREIKVVAKEVELVRAQNVAAASVPDAGVASVLARFRPIPKNIPDFRESSREPHR